MLVEHASQPDPSMSLRSLLYAVLYWERRWQAWENRPAPRGPLRLSPVLPVVFATGLRPWTASRAFLDLFGDPGPFRPFIPSWQPLLWQVATRTPEDLLAAPGEWLQAMAVIRVEEEGPEEFQRVFAEVMQRLEPLHEAERARWLNLMWFLLSWAVRRRPGEEREAILAATEARFRSVAIQQEVRNMAGMVGQRWEDEVFARGQLRMARANLRALLAERFGTLPEELIQRIETTNDVARLQAALLQVLRINAASELSL